MPTYLLQDGNVKNYPNSNLQSSTSLLSHEGLVDGSYRITAEKLSLFRQALAVYSPEKCKDKFGTTYSMASKSKNYHNYTQSRKFQDSFCQRSIISFTCSDPVVREGGLEWVTLRIHGVSFLLHQIRKMIALVVLIVRTRTPVCLIDRSFENVKLNIPRMPGAGLLLERVNNCILDHFVTNAFLLIIIF